MEELKIDVELEQGTKEKILRRYIDLPKLIDLLLTSELYFGLAANFEDRLEGTLPDTVRQCMRANAIDPVGEELRIKQNTYLNCWSLGAKDNIALWKIYGGGLKECVAITTTPKKLAQAALNWGSFGYTEIRKVRYIDHAGKVPRGVYSLSSNIFSVKHISYLFEKEVRVVLTRRKEVRETINSLRLPVNLNSFIRSIVLAPEAEEWFCELVKDVVEKYKVTAPVRKSKLTRLINSAG